MTETNGPLAGVLQFAQLATYFLALVTAYVALRGVDAWRRQVTGTRKIELAERALTLFYQARDSIAWARNRFLIDSELAQVVRGDDEPEHAYRSRQAVGVLLNRIRNADTVFAEIDAIRYRFHAIFGSGALEPFDEMRKAVAELTSSAGALAQTEGFAAEDRLVGEQTPLHRIQEIHLWRERVYGGGHNDKVAPHLNKAIVGIERLCTPVLEPSRGWRNWWARSRSPL